MGAQLRLLAKAVAAGALCLVIAGVGLFAFGESLAPWFFPEWPTPEPMPSEREAETVDFTYEDCNVVISVQVGEKSYPLVLDTGATATTVDRRIAESVTRVWPLPLPLDVATLPGLGVGGLEFSDVRVAVFDSSEETPRWADGTRGLLGSDFLEKVTVTLDFDNRKMTIRPPGAGAAPDQNHSVPLTVSETQPIRPTVPVRVDGTDGEMLFDLGAQFDLTLSPTFSDVHSSLQKGATPRSDGAPWSTASNVEVALGDVPIGPAETRLYERKKGPFDSGMDGNLGCGLLTNLNSMTIDYESNRVYFDDG